MLLSRGISKPLIKSLIHLHIFYRLTSITRFVFTQFYLHCHILLWYIYEQYIETISYHPFNVLINIHLPIFHRLVFGGILLILHSLSKFLVYKFLYKYVLVYESNFTVIWKNLKNLSEQSAKDVFITYQQLFQHWFNKKLILLNLINTVDNKKRYAITNYFDLLRRSLWY